MQLQDIHISHRHLAVEAVAGAAVVKIDLTRRIKPGAFEHRRHVALARAVAHRGAERDAQRQMPGHPDDLLAAARLDVALILERKSVVSGKKVSVRVDLGGRRIIKKKKITHHRYKQQY